MPALRYALYFLVFMLPFEALRLPGNLPLVRTLGLLCVLAIIVDFGRNVILKKHYYNVSKVEAGAWILNGEDRINNSPQLDLNAVFARATVYLGI